MKREKSNILSRRPESIIFMLLIGLVSVLLNFTFSQNSFAEYKATLSASVNEDTAAIDGTEVIESSDETTEHAINLKVKTTNKTGYTATISSKTEDTALSNTNPAINTKINSISSTYSLSNFPVNTWGYSFNTNTNFNPIPALSAPANLIHTTEKSASEENHIIKLGMKLNSSLKPGNYENKLIISIVSNPYTPKAVMAEGQDFNEKLKDLETATNKIEHFKNSTVAPAASMNAVNIEDEDSDYEIKLWLDPTDKTAYYYAETEKVYLNTDSSFMFSYLSSLTSLDLSNFNTSQVTDMRYMFYEMSSNLTTLDLSNFDTSKVTNMGMMFDGMSNITTLNLSNFDTSKVTNMHSMFSRMSNLTSLDLSNFDTSQVTVMTEMFEDMSNLITLNLSNFDTSKVKIMYAMFRNITNLTSLDLSNFDTSKVTDMGYMFSGMSNLTTLDLSNFDTSKVESMGSMFSGMSKITSLDVSNFDTSKVTYMDRMFFGMSNLTTLDLSNFDTSKVWCMDDMFSLKDEDMSKDKLERIYITNDFNTAKLTDFTKMFKNRKKLRGGNGSYLSDPSTADKSWLRIDDPANGRPGYFTRKP